MHQDKKTLIILIPGFPANEEDGTCLPFPQSFVRNLRRLNPSLHIIVMAFQYPFSESVYNWHGVRVHAFNGRNRGKISRLLLWWTVWRKLKNIMKENRVSVILNFWLGECALLGKYAAIRYNTRSFTWLMRQDAKKNNRYVSLVRPQPGSLIALSEAIAGEFQSNYSIRPAHTIPPGIDRISFPPPVAEKYIDIMGAGSLIPLKQYDHFIQAIAGIARSRPGIKAIICGDGPERPKLQQLINDLGLNDQVELRGELAHWQVLELMGASKIFLHPSSYEGFSIACAEALYGGAQVVSYCQPMGFIFDHQHIVNTQAELESTTNRLLHERNLCGDPVLTYPIEETCSKMISLLELI